MTMTDPIADMLTRIRNANTVGHDTVDAVSYTHLDVYKRQELQRSCCRQDYKEEVRKEIM